MVKIQRVKRIVMVVIYMRLQKLSDADRDAKGSNSPGGFFPTNTFVIELIPMRYAKLLFAIFTNEWDEF